MAAAYDSPIDLSLKNQPHYHLNHRHLLSDELYLQQLRLEYLSHQELNSELANQILLYRQHRLISQYNNQIGEARQPELLEMRLFHPFMSATAGSTMNKQDYDSSTLTPSYDIFQDLRQQKYSPFSLDSCNLSSNNNFTAIISPKKHHQQLANQLMQQSIKCRPQVSVAAMNQQQSQNYLNNRTTYHQDRQHNLHGLNSTVPTFFSGFGVAASVDPEFSSRYSVDSTSSIESTTGERVNNDNQNRSDSHRAQQLLTSPASSPVQRQSTAQNRPIYPSQSIVKSSIENLVSNSHFTDFQRNDSPSSIDLQQSPISSPTTSLISSSSSKKFTSTSPLLKSQQEKKRIRRPLMGKHVEHGTGASVETLATLRKVIEQRQQLKAS